MNILVIEDKDLDLLFIKRSLQVASENIKLVNATRIKQGLEFLLKDQFDCILLDLHLPDGGTEIESFDKVFTAHPTIPIILLTGSDDDDLALELIDKGAQDFIVKDEINTRDLLKAIKFSIKRIRTENEFRELNATKDKFFSIMAHDLKNPLSIFSLATETLAKEYKELSEDDLSEYLNDLKDNAKNIYELLENLLTWSRTQRSKIVSTPDIVNLSFIVNNNLSLYHQAGDEKNISFITDVPEDFKAFTDSNLVSTILRNLIGNAIKFTPSGGKIHIRCKNNPKYFEFSVQDNGIGMSELAIDNLFKIDVNTSTPGTNNEKGTGLGLIVCKEFANIMGGKIWAESKIDHGTTFFFTIPKNYDMNL